MKKSLIAGLFLAVSPIIFAQDPPPLVSRPARGPAKSFHWAPAPANNPEKMANDAGAPFREGARSEEEYQTVIRQSGAEREKLKSEIQNLEKQNADLKRDEAKREDETTKAWQKVEGIQAALQDLKNSYARHLEAERDLRQNQLEKDRAELESADTWRPSKVYMGLIITTGVLTFAAGPTAFGLAAAGLGNIAVPLFLGSWFGGIVLLLIFYGLRKSASDEKYYEAARKVTEQEQAIADINGEIKQTKSSNP